MDITDILSNLPGKSSNTLAKNALLNSEKRRITRRADDFVYDIINYIQGEIKYINNNMSYNYDNNTSPKLSEGDKAILTEVLKKSVIEIPAKLKAELDSIFSGTDSESKEEEKSETPVEKPATISFSAFKY